MPASISWMFVPLWLLVTVMDSVSFDLTWGGEAERYRESSEKRFELENHVSPRIETPGLRLGGQRCALHLLVGQKAVQAVGDLPPGVHAHPRPIIDTEVAARRHVAVGRH